MPLLVLAGLPATGKTTLGLELALRLPAHMLDKDQIRFALFAPHYVDYSAAQDDFVFRLMQQTAAWLWRDQPELWLVLGGRTFSQKKLREEVRHWAGALGQPMHLIECVCPEEIVRERLAQPHPAANRNWVMWQRLRDSYEPIEEAHLVLDTSTSLDDCVRQALTFLAAASSKA